MKRTLAVAHNMPLSADQVGLFKRVGHDGRSPFSCVEPLTESLPDHSELKDRLRHFQKEVYGILDNVLALIKTNTALTPANTTPLLSGLLTQFRALNTCLEENKSTIQTASQGDFAEAVKDNSFYKMIIDSVAEAAEKFESLISKLCPTPQPGTATRQINMNNVARFALQQGMLARNDGQQVTLNCPDLTLEETHATGLLESFVHNVVLNAAQHSQCTAILVNVEIYEDPTFGRFYIVSVTDNGKGLRADKLREFNAVEPLTPGFLTDLGGSATSSASMSGPTTPVLGGGTRIASAATTPSKRSLSSARSYSSGVPQSVSDQHRRHQNWGVGTLNVIGGIRGIDGGLVRFESPVVDPSMLSGLGTFPGTLVIAQIPDLKPAS